MIEEEEFFYVRQLFISGETDWEAFVVTDGGGETLVVTDGGGDDFNVPT